MAEVSENKSKKPKSGSFVKELISGIIVSDVIILKNIWYILMLTVLAAIYIGNRFHAEKITRETSRFSREVRDLRAEALSTSANLMYVSKQSEVYRMVREKGLELEELKTPAYKIIIDK